MVERKTGCCGDHGPETRVGDALIDAEADRKGTATGDETGRRMTEEDSSEEAEGDGDDANQRRAE